MSRKQKNKFLKKIAGKRKRGYVTAYVLMGATLSIIILTGLMVFVTSNQRRSLNEAARQESIHAAENGIYYYSWYLSHNLDGKNAQQINEFWQNGSPLGVDAPLENEIKDLEGVALGKYQVSVDPPDPSSTIVNVTSTGWTYKHPEIKRTIKVRFRRKSWSEYAVLGNDVMRFGADTTVYGEIHSNNGIRFDGEAHNVVSSAVSTYVDPDTGQVKPGVWTSQANPNDVFLSGTLFPATAVDFNGVIGDFSYMREQSQDGGIFLNEQFNDETECSWKHGKTWCGCNSCWCQVCDVDQVPIEGYHLTLRADDKVEVRRVLDYKGDNNNEPKQYKIMEETEAVVMDFPDNGLIYVENHVWVDGVVDTAKLTIVSAMLDSPVDTDIYLNNDITYAEKDGSAVLGLIAENNISVGLFSEIDLEINAALLARKGRVGRDYYSGSHMDKISIWGAIASNQRYGFAWTDGTGYELRDIYYDNNLTYMPPPYFPTGSTYNLDLWEEQ